jgi:CRISPR-associated endonuclease Cas1
VLATLNGTLTTDSEVSTVMATGTVSPVAASYADSSARGVVIAGGYGVQITVKSGHLLIQDGLGRARRERRIPRVPRRVERLVILSSTGMITTEAIRWLADAGIPWVHLAHDGQTIATSGPGSLDARLVRAQSRAYAGDSLESVGLEITRYLIMQKIQGQLANVSKFFTLPDTEAYLKNRLADLEQAESTEAIGGIEGQAASAYWQAWSKRVYVPFAPGDLLKVPAHWLAFTQRQSLVHPHEKNMDADNPVCATLNYLYSLGESEATHVCHMLGLLPVLGINHTDKPNRDSLSLDFLEAIRPVADGMALQIFDTGLGIPYDARTGKPQYFDRRWLTETRDGTVRLCPPFTHALASHAAELGSALAPHAQIVAKMLSDAADGMVKVRVLPAARRKASPSLAKAKHDHPVNRLRPGVRITDVIPDALWEQIAPILTERTNSGRGRKPEPPTRELVGAMVLRYVLKVPWHQAGMKQDTAEAWLAAWSDESNAPMPSVWARVRAIVEASGHLAALVA